MSRRGIKRYDDKNRRVMIVPARSSDDTPPDKWYREQVTELKNKEKTLSIEKYNELADRIEKGREAHMEQYIELLKLRLEVAQLREKKNQGK